MISPPPPAPMPVRVFAIAKRSLPTSAESPPTLTPAETRVLAFLLEGLANKEIASALNRSEATVKNQVAAILRKYRVPSRTRLLAMMQTHLKRSAPAGAPDPEAAPPVRV